MITLRLPNGYGGITKLPGNRRRPWRVRLTTGYTMGEDGRARQQYTTLGYYATREEAILALAEYNKNPLSLEKGITFGEVYRRWSKEQFTARPKTKQIYSAAYAAVSPLHEKEFRKLKRNDLQSAIDNSGKNYPTIKMIRLLMNQLYKYAMQNDLVERDYSQFVDISRHKHDNEEREEVHTNIKHDEISALWDHADDPAVKEVLALIYSGLRIGEFLSLKPEDVDTEARFITIRRSKTVSGKRKVPIAAKTLPFWKELKENAGDCLISLDCSSQTYMRYKTYRERFESALVTAGANTHLPHDTRHTTASLLHDAGVDPYTVKKILGHSSSDVTEAVYTHIADDKLLEAIDLI